MQYRSRICKEERKQRVVLNDRHSKCLNISAGVSQGLIQAPHLFLIYINNLSDNLISNPKLFADGTSLFSIVQDINQSVVNLNDDFKKISNWDFQWKMSFNLNINKQAQEVIFSRKLQNLNQRSTVPALPSLQFRNTLECFWIQNWIIRDIYKMYTIRLVKR